MRIQISNSCRHGHGLTLTDWPKTFCSSFSYAYTQEVRLIRRK